jgi:hypothetical protein
MEMSRSLLNFQAEVLAVSVTARGSKLQAAAGLRLSGQRASRLAFPVRAKNGRLGVDSVSARLSVGRWPLTQLGHRLWRPVCLSGGWSTTIWLLHAGK